MRIFIALLFSEIVKNKIFGLVNELEKKFEGNFTARDNLHLTLYYIGEIDKVLLEKVKKEIKEINFNKFSYETLGIGSFKNSFKHRLLHLTVKEDISLKSIHVKVLNALKKSGIEINNLDFTPHITLGRKVFINDLEMKSIKFSDISILASRISVMESKRIDGNLVYEEIDYQLLK